MIENLPGYVALVFGLTTLLTLLFFIRAVKGSDLLMTRKRALPIFVGLTLWLAFQAILALKDVYSADTETFPPKIMLVGILPPVVIIILLFAMTKGRQFIDSLSLKVLTYLNIVRLPVEIVLFWLFLNKAVPELMTFEGRNLDILAGVSAPFIAYFGLTKKRLSRRTVLLWNVACLGLLVNIVANALFSAPSPIQRFAFDQPNIAILYFPFTWLPTFIVPVVLFGHLAAIRSYFKGPGK